MHSDLARMTASVVAAMEKPTRAERAQALFALWSDGRSRLEKRALYGVIATFIARCDGVPERHSDEFDASGLEAL